MFLNEQFSLQYDRNPIESIKARVKSFDSILKKVKRKQIPFSLESIEGKISTISQGVPRDLFISGKIFICWRIVLRGRTMSD